MSAMEAGGAVKLTNHYLMNPPTLDLVAFVIENALLLGLAFGCAIGFLMFTNRP
jgi:hypothetical protein